MKIKTVLQKFIIKAFKQFMFPMIFLLLFSALAIWMIIVENNDENLLWILNNLGLAIVYSVFITVLADIKQNKLILYIGNIILIIALVVFYFLVPKEPPLSIIYRNVVVYIVGILGILSLPQIAKQDQNTFWNYNYEIFLQGIITYVFAVVLFVGLSIALGLLNLLFDMDVSTAFIIVFLISMLTFAGTLFFSLFPKYDIQIDEKYPKLLRILVFYLLIPLTIIYLLILYVYMVKVLVTWHIPTGEVSYMVLSFSGLGLLSLMAIFPILKDEKYKFIQKFSKFFYPALFPLIVLLFVSIIKRIGQYGITENRFYLLIFALWMIFISIYMMITKMKSISIVHNSLIVLLLVSSFGPWSAFNISKNNQLKRMVNIIDKYNVNENALTIDIPRDDYYELRDITNYLIQNHGLKIVEDQYNIDLDDSMDVYYLVDDFIRKMNIKIVDSSNTYEEEQYFGIYSEDKGKVINISGYNFLISNINLLSNTENDSITVFFNKESFNLEMTIGNKLRFFNIEKDIKKIIKENINNNTMDKIFIISTLSDDSLIKCKIVINSLTGYWGDTLKIDKLNVDLLIKEKC